MRKTRELVMGMDGDLQPVYTPTIVSKWLDEAGLKGQFDEYLKKTGQEWVHLKDVH